MTPARSIAEDDCLRVATATILDLSPRRVPHFIKRTTQGRDWYAVWSEWLATRGLRPVPHRFATLADAPKGEWIAIVDEDFVDWSSHAVVMRGRRVIHDLGWDGHRRRYWGGYTLEPVA